MQNVWMIQLINLGNAEKARNYEVLRLSSERNEVDLTQRVKSGQSHLFVRTLRSPPPPANALKVKVLSRACKSTKKKKK